MIDLCPARGACEEAHTQGANRRVADAGVCASRPRKKSRRGHRSIRFDRATRRCRRERGGSASSVDSTAGRTSCSTNPRHPICAPMRRANISGCARRPVRFGPGPAQSQPPEDLRTRSTQVAALSARQTHRNQRSAPILLARVTSPVHARGYRARERRQLTRGAALHRLLLLGGGLLATKPAHAATGGTRDSTDCRSLTRITGDCTNRGPHGRSACRAHYGTTLRRLGSRQRCRALREGDRVNASSLLCPYLAFSRIGLLLLRTLLLCGIKNRLLRRRNASDHQCDEANCRACRPRSLSCGFHVWPLFHPNQSNHMTSHFKLFHKHAIVGSEKLTVPSRNRWPSESR